MNRVVHDRVAAMQGSVAAEHGVGRLKVDEIVRLKPAVEIDMEAVSTPRTPDPFDSDASWSPRSGPLIFRTVSIPERPPAELATVPGDGPPSSGLQHGTKEVFIEGLTSLSLS